MEGKYVRMVLAPKARRLGTIIRARYDRGAVQYLFQHDPRLDDGFPDIWLLESEIEPCERPSDLEVAAMKGLVDLS